MMSMTMGSILLLSAIAGCALVASNAHASPWLLLGLGGQQAAAEPTPVAPPAPADSDGDGVRDTKDRCPGTPADTKVDVYGCKLDSDSDGVLDSDDHCPNTAPGVRVDTRGCEVKDEIRLPGVVFATDMADLLPESFPVLNDAIATLKKYPELNIEVAGHTDNRGSDAHNRKLSQRRADTVAKYLRDGGATNDFKAVGYGAAQPVTDNNTELGRQQNRRVVLKILEQ
jgi:OOP family OmpA-OmpF porin